MTQDLPRWHHPAHSPPVQRHNQPTILLLSVCTVERQPILANVETQAALVAIWQEITDWLVGSYVIMPDHLHMFCSAGPQARHSVTAWCGYWKRQVGQRADWLKQAFQDDCWDVQMRNLDHYQRKLTYVRQNPVRKNLAVTPESWPYSGTVHPLPWF